MIPDPKYSRPEIFGVYVRQATALGRLDVLQRLLPHVADQAELNTLRGYFPLQNYVLALYHTQALNRYDDPEVVDFVRRNRTPAVMMWWRDRDFSISLAANGQQSAASARHSPTACGAPGRSSTCTASPTRSSSSASGTCEIGGYSDEPFPPLGTTTPALRTPTFSTTRTKQATPPRVTVGRPRRPAQAGAN